MRAELRNRISIGWNGQVESLDVFIKYREFIHDVYFSAPQTPSGRNNKATRSNNYTTKIDLLLNGLSSNGIRANMLFNGMCCGELTGTKLWARHVFSTLERYIEQGVTHVTCISITDMILIKKYFPQIKIAASVNMFIDSIDKCAQIRNVVDTICIDRNINYDLQKINNIRNYSRDKKLKILVNEGCLTNCIHRIQHFNTLAHNRNLETGYCKYLFVKDPTLILETPFIRPEDLHHYFRTIDYFKIATRDAASPERIEQILKAYIEGIYDGNLFDLVSSDGIAAVQSMGIPVFIDNSLIPWNFYEHRVSRKNEWAIEQPISIADIFGDGDD